MKFLNYYSRREILKELVEVAKDREVQMWFGDIPGQRPDTINFEGDILASAKRGMSSMHISEERWMDPLKLKSGMTKNDLDSLRKGWDLILDIDCKRLEYSRLAAILLVDALKFSSVKNISIKFSGNTGFHIGVPFEAFPEKVNNIKIKDLFPEGPRMIASYLKEIIREHLIAKFMELDKDLDIIAKKFGKTKKDVLIEGKFNPYSILDIDPVLISSRHMIRAPYSINEKTGLVSLPLNYEDILRFSLVDARPESVKFGVKFLDREKIISGSAKHLVLQAFDFCEKKKEFVVKDKVDFEIPKDAVKFDKFPPCIINCLNGIKEDGRKRGVFVLINFLRHMGYDFDKIKTLLLEWNGKNYEKLREGYIISQLNWFKGQKNLILPPNCDNEVYYHSIGICKPDSKCKLIKNPVNYYRKK